MYVSDINGSLTAPEARLNDLEHEIEALQGRLKQLKADAIHDQETGLYSNAYFHTRLEEEIKRSERYRHFFSLILIHIRIRHSCSVNDLNQEIRKICMELQDGLMRCTDIIAFYRDRQVVLMLPETDPKGVEHLLARFQAMFPNEMNGRPLTHRVLTYPRDASNIELALGRLHDASQDLLRGDRSIDLYGEDPVLRQI